MFYSRVPGSAYCTQNVTCSTVAGAVVGVVSAMTAYPARPDDVVYHDVNLMVAPGETLALVGPSGGGA